MITKANIYEKKWLFIGTVFLGTGCILGAFSAHALKNILTPIQLHSFETGVRYQMYHGLALLIIGTLKNTISKENPKKFQLCSISLAVGTTLFSGSLYILSLSGPKFFGPITPIGGMLLILGWILFAVNLLKN